jgi:hypothetical protein
VVLLVAQPWLPKVDCRVKFRPKYLHCGATFL